MKKLLFIMLLGLTHLTYSQQVANLNYLILDQNNLPVPNISVSVAVGPPSSAVYYTYISNINGQVQDSVSASVPGIIMAIANSGGCSDTSTYSYTQSGSGTFTVSDTLYVCSNTSNCQYTFGTWPDTTNPLAFYFWHQPNVSPGTSLLWDFGDGNTSTQLVPYHTYAAPGTYIYCLTVSGCPTVCDTIVIPGTPPAPCTASFIIDTAMSQPGQVVVWNTSTPTYYPNTPTQYIWDFGDGTLDSSAFPSHTYAGPGTYVICLSIYVPPTVLNPACTSTFCDSLKVDSLGNIIQKSTGASFTLNVLNANAIGIDEHVDTEFNIYPNPANEIININFDAASAGSLTTEVIDMNGRTISTTTTKSQTGNNRFLIDVSPLEAGVYFIRMKLNEEVYYKKIIKQ